MSRILSPLLLGLAFLLLLFSVFSLIFVLPRPEKSAPVGVSNSAVSPSTDASRPSFEGSLLILPEAEAGISAYRLVNGRGQILAYLQSGRIDLRILQSGLKVLIEGRREKILEHNIPLIAVDKLSFR